MPLLPRDGIVRTPSAAVADALTNAGFSVAIGPLDGAPQDLAPHERPDAVALLDGELSTARDHAEGLLAAAVDLVRPGGVVAVAAASAVAIELGTIPSRGRGFRADELARALGHRGVDVELLAAPGAAAAVGGEPDGPHHPDLDRLPGLVDAGPHVLAVGRAPRSAAERSDHFFATLPYKIVAAAVLCRDAHDRLLVVHDSFKGHWTIPGGVVDADEDPRAAAEREAWEEAGVRVIGGRVLGVFSASWPDRVVLVYAATLVDHAAAADAAAVHAHEIDAVDWWPVGKALGRLAPYVAEQVRHCLEHPGTSLRQGRS